MLGGGRRKDRKSKPEKKQAAIPKRLEQKCAGELKSARGPTIRECDHDAVIRMIEETKGIQRSLSVCQKEVTSKRNRRCNGT